MSGQPVKSMTQKQVRAAVRAIPPGSDFVWDGIDEDDRPLTEAELTAGLEVALRKRGRPAGTATKEQVAIRFDREILETFRKDGPGWQTRMNDALRDWIKSRVSSGLAP